MPDAADIYACARAKALDGRSAARGARIVGDDDEDPSVLTDKEPLESGEEKDFFPAFVESDFDADVFLPIDDVGEHLLVEEKIGRKTFRRLSEPRVDAKSLKIHS
jgi:hypothetical protein